MTKNVFVVGLNDYNAERLKRLRGVEDVGVPPAPDAGAGLRDAGIRHPRDAEGGRGDARRLRRLDRRHRRLHRLSRLDDAAAALREVRHAQRLARKPAQVRAQVLVAQASCARRSPTTSRSSPPSTRSTTTRCRRSARPICAFRSSSSRSSRRARGSASASTAPRTSTTRSRSCAPRSGQIGEPFDHVLEPGRPARRDPRGRGPLLHGRAGDRRPPVHRRGLRPRRRGRALRHGGLRSATRRC